MEEDIRIIEDYITGRLNEEQKKAVHERLERDSEFRQQFEFEKQMFEVFNEEDWSFSDQAHKEIDAYKRLLQENDVQNLKKTITGFSKQKAQKPKKNYTFLYLAAASIVGLILVLQFFYNQGTTTEELYSQYANLDDLPGFVTRSNSENDELIQAQQLFEDKEYQAAIQKFELASENRVIDARIYIYLGLAYLEIDNYEKAENTFDDLINSDLIDSQKGYWYKALVYLKRDNVSKTKSQLNEIITNGYFNKSKAQDLLEELD